MFLLRSSLILFLVFAPAIIGPQLYLYLNTPEGKSFEGLFVNPPDTYSYRMWMSQYSDGFLAENLYEMSGEKIRYFNPMLFIESLPINSLGIDFWIVDISLKIALFAGYLACLERIVDRCVEKKDREIALALIVLFASPFTMFLFETTFLSGYLYTLTALHLFLQAGILLLAISEYTPKNALLLFAALLFLFLSHPYALIYLLPALGAYFLFSRKEGSKKYLALLAFASAISAAAYSWQLNVSEQHLAWARYRFDTGFTGFFLFFLPFSITAVSGLWHSFKRGADEWVKLMACWIIVVSAVMLLLPFLGRYDLPIQPHKFAIGFAAPLVLLSFRDAGIAGFLRENFPLILSLFAFFNFFYLASILGNYVVNSYISDDLMASMAEIAEDKEIKVVLASEQNSVLVPAFTEKYALPGHWGLTRGYEENAKLARIAIEAGDESAIKGFCMNNAEAALLTERGEGAYETLKGFHGTEFFGDAAVAKCANIV